MERFGHLSGGEKDQGHHDRAELLVQGLRDRRLPEGVEPPVSPAKAPCPLGNRGSVREVGEHVRPQRAVRGEPRRWIEDRVRDRVVEGQDLVQHRVVENRIPSLCLTEDPRQPLGRWDHLRSAGHREEKALQLVIPQRVRGAGRISQEACEARMVHSGHSPAYRWSDQEFRLVFRPEGPEK